jgi:uncharacterized protein (DUF1330 family)
MPKGYWVVAVDISDSQRYAEYQAFVSPFLAEVGGRFVVRAGRRQLVEGVSRDRNVVVEFDSFEAAVDAYHSDAYQRGMRLRTTASVADFVIVEGLEG